MSNTDKTFSKRKEGSFASSNSPLPRSSSGGNYTYYIYKKDSSRENRRLRKMHVFSDNLGSFTRKGRPKYPGDLSPTSIPKLDLLG